MQAPLPNRRCGIRCLQAAQANVSDGAIVYLKDGNWIAVNQYFC
jgi:hypothetical protein